jgi:iron complex transport system substrate-binding protein
VATLRQAPDFNLRLTVQELVAFGRFPYSRGALTGEDHRVIDEAMSFSSLQPLRRAYLDELSGGQRQMAFLAMTIAQQTDYLLLDEPLNNLDIKHAVQIMRALRRLCDEQGRTVILVVHDINFAAQLLRPHPRHERGAVQCAGSVAEVVNETQPGRTVRPGLRDHPGRPWPPVQLLQPRMRTAMNPSHIASGLRPVTAAALGAGQRRNSAATPISVTHAFGAAQLHPADRAVQRVVALDMNEVDFLDQLGVPVAGMPKDFVPQFLQRYKNDAAVVDTGAIVQPNLERVHAAKPDLILITSLQAPHYGELSEIAPTVHFDVDYRDSQKRHIEVIKQHLLTLGQIFAKPALAQQQVTALDAKVAEAKRITADRPERALVVLHNNGAFSSFGVQSRYGFVFTELGVKPASPTAECRLAWPADFQ